MKKNRCAQTFDSKIMFLKSKNIPEKKKGEESKVHRIKIPFQV